jgi:hypothetical protein
VCVCVCFALVQCLGMRSVAPLTRNPLPYKSGLVPRFCAQVRPPSAALQCARSVGCLLVHAVRNAVQCLCAPLQRTLLLHSSQCAGAAACIGSNGLQCCLHRHSNDFSSGLAVIQLSADVSDLGVQAW